MKIIAFIERRQTAVIEKILRHCGLWEEGSARGTAIDLTALPLVATAWHGRKCRGS
jgi:hypothetical protein